MSILRYDETNTIGTDLDPIEDILNFICTLRSKGFTSDLLRETHGFTNADEIKKTTALISLHVDNAVGLANQGFSGPPETSFLPLYYSTLNLSKVYLLFLGKRIDLERNRWHGAKYSESEMKRNFLNERVEISNRGTIPLLYRSVTNKIIGRSGFKITLKEIYQNINSIGAEYSTVTKQRSGLMAHEAKIIQDDINGHYIKITIEDSDFQTNPPTPRTIKAYSGLRLIRGQDGLFYYETRKVRGHYETIKNNYIETIKRYLNSDEVSSLGSWTSFTPINGRSHIFNEELCIMLAYFHLSNVVRYNPEHLYKIMDSKYWAILLGLRKHGFLRFEKLMWGNFIKKSFGIY